MTTTTIRTCQVCGHEGIHIHEYPTYSNVLKRDTTELQCDDITACLDRKYNGTPYERRPKMTLDEAIKELKGYNRATWENHFVPFSHALQLGIEALKMIDNLRFDGSPFYPNLLLGETKDAEGIE